MLEILLIVLVVLLTLTTAIQRQNFVRARHLLKSGGWSVSHATDGGTRSDWYYWHKDRAYSCLSEWTLGEAYERQLELDRRRRLDLPKENKDGK